MSGLKELQAPTSVLQYSHNKYPDIGFYFQMIISCKNCFCFYIAYLIQEMIKLCLIDYRILQPQLAVKIYISTLLVSQPPDSLIKRYNTEEKECFSF